MLVIFDCDGVLVDTEPVSCQTFAAALVPHGLHWSVAETMHRLMGRSLASCIGIVEQELGRKLPDDFAERLQAETFEAFRTLPIAPVAGVPAMLDALKKRGIDFCVASSGAVHKMQLTLGLTGLWPHFEGRVFSASMVPRGKPYPDLFLHAAAGLGVEPRRCVVVEDAIPGVQAGRAAGMRVLAYAGAPYADRAGLEAAGGQPFDRMRDLPLLLLA